MDSRLSPTKRTTMKDKKTQYLLFGSGVLVGVLATYAVLAKEHSDLFVKAEKIRTVADLVLEMDKWIWMTIDDPVDTEKWAEELKDRLEYIEMIIALYSFEE
jgi:hypothetical protein